MPIGKGGDGRSDWDLDEGLGVAQLVVGEGVQLHPLVELVGLAADEHRLAKGGGHHRHCRCPGPAQHRAVRVHGRCPQEHLRRVHVSACCCPGGLFIVAISLKVALHWTRI